MKLANHFVELVVPFWIFGPRLVRRVGGVLLVTFQVILILSGNLSFLNWLTAVICFAALDDGFLGRFAVDRVRRRVDVLGRGGPPSVGRRVVIGGLALVLGVLSVKPVVNMCSSSQVMNTSFDRLHLLNTYGAFGSVGKERYEVILSGTRDDPRDPNAVWLEYEFKAKPGDVRRRPAIIAPYQYRIDWQIWFAAMSNYQSHPWLVHLAWKFLQGDEQALTLIAKNPFGDEPPHFIKAELYRYQFSKSLKDGQYWERERVADYMPPLSLDNPSVHEFLRAHGWDDR